MKIVIQRVNSASIKIDGEPSGSINKGFVVLFGVTESDTREITDKMLKKLIGLRIFDDAEGKTNLALSDVGGEILFVSQFTLYADCKKGYRPSFINAGSPAHAQEIYDYAVEQIQKTYGFVTQTGAAQSAPAPKLVTGSFGAHMEITLVNDGPFTIVLDSAEIVK